ncbi:MAG: ABC transporter transmembrane domain-containing protein [Hyphomicrobiales bacterium]
MSENNGLRASALGQKNSEPVTKVDKKPISTVRPKYNAAYDKEPHKNFVQKLFGPIIGIGSLIRELSPKGLAKRGIPFSDTLKMPKSVLVASIIINCAGLALPLVILQVYDRVIPNQAIDTFALMMFGLASVVIIEGLLRVARSYVVSWSATRFTKAITQDLISRFLYASKGSFVGISQAKTIEKLSNINRVAEFYGGQSRLMFIDLPFALLFLALMGLIGGWLVVVPFMILCLFGVVTITSSLQYKKILEEKEEHEARTYDFVAESLKGIVTMKCQSAEPFLVRRFERLQAKNAQLHYSIIVAAMASQSIASLLGNGTMIAMVTTGAWMAVHGNMSVGVLACCSLLSGRAVQPILRVASTWNDFQRARLSVNEVSKLFALEDIPVKAAIDNDPPTPEVTAQSVSIDMGPTSISLSDLNFKIESGESIMIMGPDGSGKTSVLNIIAGLNRPTSGTITLGDMPAYEFRRSYRAAVGTSDANTEVFAGSIFDNLSLFGQGANVEDVRWATDIIDIEREIDKLPEGYDTPLGRGISETLPAPFISRLLMARVLAQKPVLWALDEPQAELDARGQETFIKAIDSLRGWVTVIFTSNSESLARNVDRIFYVNNGRLTIYNSYDEMKADLINNNFVNVDVDSNSVVSKSAAAGGSR